MMVTDFTSMFHESGFIFVNEFKSDIKYNNDVRVERQRDSSKEGHRVGKGVVHRVRKSDSGYTRSGSTTRQSAANASNYEHVPDGIKNATDKRNHDSSLNRMSGRERDKESRRQMERSAKKQRAKHESAELGFEII